MIVKKRKGISTFIATLLLMVLAVAAGVVIYAYVMGYLGGFTTPQTMGALSLDSSVLSATGGVTAYIRNIGHASFTAQSVYVSTGTTTISIPSTGAGSWTFNSGNAVPEGGVGVLNIPQTGTTPPLFVPNQTYTIKIIGADNTQITFNVKIG